LNFSVDFPWVQLHQGACLDAVERLFQNIENF